jgi:hypothetical protein
MTGAKVGEKPGEWFSCEKGEYMCLEMAELSLGGVCLQGVELFFPSKDHIQSGLAPEDKAEIMAHSMQFNAVQCATLTKGGLHQNMS